MYTVGYADSVHSGICGQESTNCTPITCHIRVIHHRKRATNLYHHSAEPGTLFPCRVRCDAVYDLLLSLSPFYTSADSKQPFSTRRLQSQFPSTTILPTFSRPFSISE